jgi:nitrite reductase/ring-hydroxylating ferredoxin subunit
VQCPLHFGKFDFTTGQPMNPPCKIPLETFAVTRDNERLLLELPAASTGLL